ncbi:MAG TPA: hypothetical protein VF526_19935 [Solirubrobacteraceae bacterium]
MVHGAQAIKARLLEAAGLAATNGANGSHDTKLSERTEQDLLADEGDPSRLLPSAEGIVTFPGLPDEVREWLTLELERVSTNGNGTNGSGTDGNRSGPGDEAPPDNALAR